MKIRFIPGEQMHAKTWFITDPSWAPDYVHISRCIEAIRYVLVGNFGHCEFSRQDMEEQ